MTLQHISIILKQYKIDTKIIKRMEDCKNRNRTKDLYRIYFYGRENAIKLYNLFYQYPATQTIRMDRKQKHFKELLLKYKTQETPNLMN